MNMTARLLASIEPPPSTDAGRAAAVWRALENVTDPEIPVLSVVDLGIIGGVNVTEARVTVEVTPTFVGCPALDVIRENIRTAVAAALVLRNDEVTVKTVFDPPWTSDRISETGRRKLTAFGLAPPGERHDPYGAATCATNSDLALVLCPHCGGSQTDLESIFGPTLCRSIHYCRDCLQSFEHFKPV